MIKQHRVENADGEGGGKERQTGRFDVVVIGGGQAGLATGYYLAKQSLPFVILDANERIGDSWRKRWDSLRLFTPARYSGLPGMLFPAPRASYPTKDGVADYLEVYAARFELPVRTGIRVDGLSREGPRYVLAAGEQRFEAANVVVASGAYQAQRVPAFAARLNPSILQLESTEYQGPSSCGRVVSWSWAQATLGQRSPTRCPVLTRPGFRAGTSGTSPSVPGQGGTGCSRPPSGSSPRTCSLRGRRSAGRFDRKP